MTKSEKIKSLLSDHPSLSFNAIAKLAGCSRALVSLAAAKLRDSAEMRRYRRQAEKLEPQPSARTLLVERRRALARIGMGFCGKCMDEKPMAEMCALRTRAHINSCICKRCFARQKEEYDHRTGRARRYYANGVRKYPLPDSVPAELIARGGKP